jgi:hypothetical protein
LPVYRALPQRGQTSDLDDWRVADAHPEKEPTRVCILEGALPIGHGHGIACPYVRDAAGHDQPFGGGEQYAGMREDFLAPERLLDPDDRHVQAFELLRVGAGVHSRETLDVDAPRSHGTELLRPHARVRRRRRG